MRPQVHLYKKMAFIDTDQNTKTLLPLVPYMILVIRNGRTTFFMSATKMQQYIHHENCNVSDICIIRVSYLVSHLQCWKMRTATSFDGGS